MKIQILFTSSLLILSTAANAQLLKKAKTFTPVEDYSVDHIEASESSYGLGLSERSGALLQFGSKYKSTAGTEVGSIDMSFGNPMFRVRASVNPLTLRMNGKKQTSDDEGDYEMLYAEIHPLKTSAMATGTSEGFKNNPAYLVYSPDIRGGLHFNESEMFGLNANVYGEFSPLTIGMARDQDASDGIAAARVGLGYDIKGTNEEKDFEMAMAINRLYSYTKGLQNSLNVNLKFLYNWTDKNGNKNFAGIVGSKDQFDFAAEDGSNVSDGVTKFIGVTYGKTFGVSRSLAQKIKAKANQIIN